MIWPYPAAQPEHDYIHKLHQAQQPQEETKIHVVIGEVQRHSINLHDQHISQINIVIIVSQINIVHEGISESRRDIFGFTSLNMYTYSGPQDILSVVDGP